MLLDNSRMQAIIEHANRLGADPLLADFVASYYKNLNTQTAAAFDDRALAAMAYQHFQLFKDHQPGTPSIAIFNPVQSMHGFDSAYTVICVVVKDRPFLTDTLLMSIDAQGLAVHRLFNTILQTQDGIAPAKESTQNQPNNKAFFYAEIDRIDDRKIIQVRQALLEKIATIDIVVGDWHAMRERLNAIKNELQSKPIPENHQFKDAALSFLDWIGENNFIFMGYREYRFDHSGNDLELYSVGGSGLGLLQGQKTDTLSESFHRLPAKLRHLIAAPQVLLLSKSAHIAPIHRPVYMDFLGIQKFDDAGKIIGEYRFLGLLTSRAYQTPVDDIPLLREKSAHILSQLEPIKYGHSYTKISHIINTLPRDDLFQASIDELSSIVLGIASLQDKNELKLFARIDHYQRFVSCLVYIPKNKFDTKLRQKIQETLVAAFNGTSSAFTTDFNEIHHTRVHFHIRTTAGQVNQLDNQALKVLEQKLTGFMRDWHDDAATAIKNTLDSSAATVFIKNYLPVIPASYSERFTVLDAAADSRYLLKASQQEQLLWRFSLLEVGESQVFSLKVYGKNTPATLSQILPILENFGAVVLSAQTYVLQTATTTAAPPVWLQEYRLQLAHQDRAAFDAVRPQFETALSEIWQGSIESDKLNTLVLSTPLDAYDVVILRALSRYMIQATAPFSADYIHETLINNKQVATLIIELFHAKFNPNKQNELPNTVKAKIDQCLTQVSSLDEDRIIHWLLDLLQAIVRTNFYQKNTKGTRKDRLSFKFKADEIPNLPKPKPMFEIYVYSPRTEGVHLRGGKVARGGLRWSDRMEDYRTEVLGLVKAQMVKNAVIVPVGSKGGFVVKDKSKQASREAWQKEGIACYQTYLRGLLDITDNLVDGKLVPPTNTIRYDADDPYLVVAADKGTATFSDIANALSKEYNFWLQDAFASGGSAGYDHKGMSITARGAWESVKRHFRLEGKDIQQQNFTVVGIGDMSGDVFGNGMLLSRHIELVAAFNHLHIFIDPNPNAQQSFAERERLFRLPRSSWADYNADLISAGGGIFSRQDKTIAISEPMKKRFGIKQDSLTPNELLHQLLQAPVDLIWNGGIGTYIKSTKETHAQVGDRANDTIRVNGEQIQARVVGEGGNLGATQLGRIEYALNGGRIYTDAIDNSGGVNCSDHEVNIKILLGKGLERGDMTLEERNHLLASMTDDVAALVLRQNYLQPQAIELSAFESHKRLQENARFISYLEQAGRLDRAIEFLPNDDTIAMRQKANQGLTNPELAILLAYGKMWVYDEMLTSDLPSDPYFLAELKKYFPKMLSDGYFDDMVNHRLHREIICTYLTNGLVNRLGIENIFALFIEDSYSIADITRAYAAVRDVFAVQGLWDRLSALDNVVPAIVQLELELEIRRLLMAALQWFLSNESGADVKQLSDTYQVLANQLSTSGKLDAWFGSSLPARARCLQEKGLPVDDAYIFARLPMLPHILDVIKLANNKNLGSEHVMTVYFGIYQALNAEVLIAQIKQLPTDSYWERKANYALLQELMRTIMTLSADLLHEKLTVDEWKNQHQSALAAINKQFVELKEQNQSSLASLSVLLSEINGLKRQ